MAPKRHQPPKERILKKIEKRKKRNAKFGCFRLKSKVSSTNAGIVKFYVDYCKETSLHGMKHTVENNLHFLERWLWLALTLSAFGGAVYCGLAQYTRYSCEPVVVSMERDYRSWSAVFPAVTACFLERVDPGKAREAIEEIWNVTEESDLEKYQYYYGFIELISDVSLRTNLQNFWKYQTDETVAGVNLLRLASDVHPLLTLKVLLSKGDKEIQWLPVMTEMGICMSFNSMWAEWQNLMPELEWAPEPLLGCHYRSQQCFVRIDSVSNSVRFFVHSPFDIPTAISNPTGEVEPLEELLMDFKVVEIKASRGVRKLRPEQRRCRYPDEWLSPSIQSYSFGLCQMHCRSKMAIMFCGCRPYFYVKGDGVVCDAHGMACIGRNVEILINLPKNLAKCSCVPQCTELNYYSHTKKVVVRNDSEAEGSDSGQVATVRFNLMPPKFRLHRDVIFTLEDLLASLGGTTALFVGASVLTVVETMMFIIRHFCDAIRGSYRRNTGPKPWIIPRSIM